MSLRQGNKIIADTGMKMPLLSFMWADHQLNDISWLCADTFSWQRRAAYQAVYNHLVNDYEDTKLYAWHTRNSGGYNLYTKVRNPEAGTQLYNSDGSASPYTVKSVRTQGEYVEYIYVDASPDTDVEFYRQNVYDVHLAETETIAGTTITYYPGNDGHKIVLSDQESNVSAIYAATGVAWYYIIDAVNERFKLPRSKHNKYADSLSVVGNGQGLGLTADNTTIRYPVNFAANNDDGSFSSTTGSTAIGSVIAGQNTGNRNQILGVATDPIKSGIIAQQEQDTDQYKYLYFYVGEFTQTAIENTAGINTELFNEKADTDLSNVNNTGKTAVVGWVMPDWKNAQNIDISVKNNPYTITENGYYVMVLNKDTANADAKILVNGIMVAVVAIGASWESTRVTLPLCVGDIVSSSGSVYSASISHYVPIKGLSA